MRNRDMNLVSEVIGEDATMKLMTELGGMYLYIPKPSSDEIEALLKENGYDAKTVAVRARVSLRKVYGVLKNMRDRAKEKAFNDLQIPLFPENK